MTTTVSNMTAKKKPEPTAEEVAVRELVRLHKRAGLSSTGPDGLLKQFHKQRVGDGPEQEMTEHLGDAKNRAPQGRESTNIRNGTRPKRVLTHATGDVELDVLGTGTAPSRLLYCNVSEGFIRMRRAGRLQPQPGATPQLHDLRHRFATYTMAAAYAPVLSPARSGP